MRDKIINRIRHDIPGEIKNIIEIKKGFSSDKKYKIELTSDELMLVRISEFNLLERYRQEFNILQKLFNMNVKCSKPVKFGYDKDLNICFMILSFIEGEDAEAVISSLSAEEQYDIGLAAGQDLRIMHSLDIIKNNSWPEVWLSKYHYYLDEYKKLDYSFPEEKRLMEFITAHLDLLDNTDHTFQHDDFHAGNIIIHNKKYNGIIDFNRIDQGDPVHDFIKMGWFSRDVSMEFCRAQVSSYYDHIPELFWPLYCLYMAMSIFATIVWHGKNFKHLLNEIKRLYEQILADHRNFNSYQPIWFK